MTTRAGWDGLVVGFDLDMTLVDTRAAMAAALARVNRGLGTDVDVDACVRELGLPQREQLARWVPAGQIDNAMRLLAAAFVAEGLPRVRALPGVPGLLTALGHGGGRAVVVTSRRARIAAACLRHCGLAVATLVGGVPGPAKSTALRQHGVQYYIGDHPLDMAAARAAGVTAIGVTTGFHDRAELADAGAALVLTDLTGFGPAAMAFAKRAGRGVAATEAAPG